MFAIAFSRYNVMHFQLNKFYSFVHGRKKGLKKKKQKDEFGKHIHKSYGSVYVIGRKIPRFAYISIQFEFLDVNFT